MEPTGAADRIKCELRVREFVRNSNHLPLFVLVLRTGPFGGSLYSEALYSRDWENGKIKSQTREPAIPTFLLGSADKLRECNLGLRNRLFVGRQLARSRTLTKSTVRTGMGMSSPCASSTIYLDIWVSNDLSHGRKR